MHTVIPSIWQYSRKRLQALVEKRHYLHHFEVTPGQQA